MFFLILIKNEKEHKRFNFLKSLLYDIVKYKT